MTECRVCHVRVYLEVHLLAVPERVPALGAAGAGRVEVVVIPGLQHLPGYKPAILRLKFNKMTKL